MIVNAGISAELATGRVTVFDVVTLRISRGRIIRFPASTGTGGVATPIVDAVRWTDAPVPLRVYDLDVETTGLPPNLYQPLSGAAYKRDRLRQSVGREVTQLGISVAGDLPINLSTACSSTGVLSGSFATSLLELCLLGLLDGARITVDQVVLPAGQLPSTPTAAGESYGIVSTIPVRRFDGIVRKASPQNERVTLECCDPLILGGGSVPVGVFSPACRWDFCEGACPVAWNLGNLTSGTHIAIPGTSVTFLDANKIQVPWNAFDPIDGVVSIWEMYRIMWAVLVPQDGPMMGMKFQLGAFVADLSNATIDFADALPWVWSCTSAHVELSCSKRLTRQPLELTARSCTEWSTEPMRAGLPNSLARFSGCPDMPQPETA